jgi:hypothetical protein
MVCARLQLVKIAGRGGHMIDAYVFFDGTEEQLK